MSLEAFSPNQEPTVVEATPDLQSFLVDVETGKITSVGELRARTTFKRNANGYVIDNGYVRNSEGDAIVERRVVNVEQQAVVKLEGETFLAIKERGEQAVSFTSYFSDITARKITSRRELVNRVGGRRNRNNYVLTETNDYARDINGNALKDTRQVQKKQADTLLQVSDLCEDAQRTVATTVDTASYAKDIVARKFSTRKECVQRLTGRRNGNGYVMADSGDYARDADRNAMIDKRQVSQNQANILLNSYDEVVSVDSFIQVTRDTSSYLESILSGQITDRAELVARVKGRRNGNGYVMNERGDYARDADRNAMIDKRQVSAEAATEILSFFDNYTSVDTDMQKVMRTMYEGSKDYNEADRIMQKRRSESLTKLDLAANERKFAAVKNLTTTVRRLKLSDTVATVLSKNPEDIRKSFELLRNFRIDDESDRSFTQTLNTVAYQARRVAFTARFLGDLTAASSTAQYGNLSGRLNEFADSPFKEDAQVASNLRTLVYRREIAGSALQIVGRLNPTNFNEADYGAYIGSLPLRASSSGFDYSKELKDVLKTAEAIRTTTKDSLLDIEISNIAGNFRSRRTRETLSAIESLDTEDDSDIRERLLAFYKQYLISRRSSRPDDYKEAFSFEIAALRDVIAPEYEFDQKLGRNLDALNYVSGRFKAAISPLFQSLRGERLGEDLEAYLQTAPDGSDPRTRFTQRVTAFEQQRELSDIERDYLNSIEALSLFNPHLAALANEAPAITSVYLASYFNSLSQKTISELQHGAYFPVIQVGLGPNGLASAGEMTRSRPDIAQQTLYIDEGDLPGGPFAIPKGPAWELNSANSNEAKSPMLPSPSPEELRDKTVRAYGSPMRWYPGERLDTLDVRQGSINSTVDYLLTPDGISDSCYPDNADLALILQLQAAVLLNKCLLKTELTSITSRSSESSPTMKQVELTHTMADGTKISRTLYTDRLIIASGLGRPSYGFNLKKSKAAEVIEHSSEWSGFPKLSDTLTAFQALGSKESDRPEPGETIVIYGNGNSADTLVEYMGGLFQGGNKGVRNIKKIYVVTTGQLSQRPRYAAISDLRGRNGRESLVELVSARVGDVAFDVKRFKKADKDTLLRIFDTDGNDIKNAAGVPIRANNVIAATGFRSGLDKVLRSVAGGSLKDPATLEKVVLPTNKNVAVADTLARDKNILLVGTGSRPGFEVIDKLSQLPETAREALLRNGAENAVAIGFRAPDTQAAVRLFTDTMPEGSYFKPETKTRVIPNYRDTKVGDFKTYSRRSANQPVRPIRKDITADSSILTPLLLGSLSDIRMQNSSDQTHDYSVRFRNGSIELTSLSPSSSVLAEAIAEACSDPYFYAYAQEALSRRRGGSGVAVKLDFKKGKINARTSFVQQF